MNVPTLLANLDLRPDALDASAAHLTAALCAEAPRLRRLAHRLLGWRSSAHELDDVVQDVLLKAWRHQHSFRGDSSLATWLVRITIRTAHDHVRKGNRRSRLFAWFGMSHQEPAAPTIGDDHEEPIDRTQRAMRQLAHQDREVLVLRYLEQREILDIAELLGITRPALDARLSRARSRLRACLGLEARQ